MESTTGKAEPSGRLTITVRLHSVLQQQIRDGQKRAIPLDLPAGATVGDVLEKLEIHIDPDALLLVIQHRVVNRDMVFEDGDHLDIFPAISGG